ncbi:YceD family protein [Natronoglycomyces albus]|uniref:DUF177 domain-containing protein n=1 Tax=Natronoglycomyces albus TaxID=2811108 RepID=A0A895XX31_9ACTN|nr:DUF177 domain-containing protein [Natronoglycomyces albus]QSB06188.1 DUF177 domain-containing protein [Natronoglycomyces albus]
MSTFALDPRAPLVIDTSDLPRTPGAIVEIEREAASEDDIGVEMLGVPAKSPLQLELQLTSVTEGVLVTGTVAAPLKGECARCLNPIDDTSVVKIQELYAYEGSTTEETTDADEVMRLQGELLDLEPAVRDALVLAMSTTPLCRPDCPGLCSICGVHWDELPTDHDHDQVDPRWAALKNLLGPDQSEN